MLLSGGVTLVSAALVGLAAVLPWRSGTDADDVVAGVHVNSDGVGEVGSRAGLDGGDGIALLVVAAAVAVVGVFVLLRRHLPDLRSTLAGAALIAGAWTWLDVTELGTRSGVDGTIPDIGIGPGPFVAIAGVALAVLAAVTMPRNRTAELVAANRVADRLRRSGRFTQSAELRQRALRRVIRRPAAADPAVVFETMHQVCFDQIAAGRASAWPNLMMSRDYLEVACADDPERLVRGRFWLAGSISILSRDVATDYAAWAWQEAHRQLPPGSPLLAEAGSWYAQVRGS